MTGVPLNIVSIFKEPIIVVFPSGKISNLLIKVSPELFHISKEVLFSPLAQVSLRLDVISPPGISEVSWSNLNAALLAAPVEPE